MKTSAKALSVLGAILIGGCASAPTGPTVMALPGTGKTFEQFRVDDMDCRQYAAYQSGATEQPGASSGVRSAALGTAIGTVAGAAIGGRDAAGVGAGTGLIIGSAAGASGSQGSAYSMQRQYDNAYIQCMYAKGERVPVSASFVQNPAPGATPPATTGNPPPPPPGSPPPPPAR